MSDLAKLSIPTDQRSAELAAREALNAAKAYAALKASECDPEIMEALNAVAIAQQTIANRVTAIVRARNVARAEREAAYRAQPYRFVINNEDGTQTKGGAESKDLAIDHLRKVARENPGVTCFYTGKRAALDRPVRIKG